MGSEEYLLLAEIEYWREMIESRKKILSGEALAQMAWLQSQAMTRLEAARGRKRQPGLHRSPTPRQHSFNRAHF
jgi:hypothetical protein